MNKNLKLLISCFVAFFCFVVTAWSAAPTCDRTYTSCTGDYYLSSGQCLTCPSGQHVNSTNTGCDSNCNTSKPCPDGYTTADGTGKYNECTITASSACYKNCGTPCSGNDTNSCPANATCTYNTNYSTPGKEYVGGSCDATATLCPVSDFYCKTNYYKNGSVCKEYSVTCTDTYTSCTGDYYLDSSSKQCLTCPSGQHVNSTNTGCEGDCSATAACPTGYTDGGTYDSCNYAAGDKCYKNCGTTCSGNDTNSCPANATCTYDTTYSTPGKEYVGGSCDATPSSCPVSEFSCVAGHYKDGNECSPVGSGYYSPDKDNNRYDCKIQAGSDYTKSDGTFSTVNNCYKECSAYESDGQTYSPVSPTVYYPYNCSYGSGTCNQQCADVKNTGTEACSDRSCSVTGGTCYYSGSTHTCNGNYTSSGCKSAGAVCTGCSSWGACEGGTRVITCGEGKYWKDSACTICPANSYCPGFQDKLETSLSDNYGLNSCGDDYKYSDSGAKSKAECYKNVTRVCTQQDGATPTNCHSATWGTCSCDGNTYRKYSDGSTDGETSDETCDTSLVSVTAKSGFRVDGQQCLSCPNAYPNSDNGNSDGYKSCYSNTKQRAWTGEQTACSKPDGCYSVTCDTCSIDSCNYVAYANAAGDGDGTVKSGCDTNNASCQQTVKSVTAKSGHRVDDKTCPSCPTAYPNSADGNTGGCVACYSNTKQRAWTGVNKSCSVPVGCSGVVCDTCSIDACDYVAYSNSACNADGTIKSGCETNSASCQQPVKSVTASTNHYVLGITCPECNTLGGGLYAYSKGTTAGAEQCYASVPNGEYLKAATDTEFTSCAPGTIKTGHTLYYSNTSSCNACECGTYQPSSGQTSCKTTDGGYYATGTGNITQTPAGVGNWAAAGSCKATACASGKTTIGYGAGADEAGDCGNIYHVGNGKIYLRSERKTIPSLNFDTNGDGRPDLYGNMSSSAHKMSADIADSLKIKIGATTYYVHDDSAN